MPVTEQQVLTVLSQCKDPELGRDVVSLGMIKNLKIDGDQVDFTLELTTPACPVMDEFREMVHHAVAEIPGVATVNVTMDAQVRRTGPTAGGPTGDLAPGVRNIIAIASGKGGVGKSTVAVNLAIALEQTGARVGLLDADIYGPNVPGMMGVTEPGDSGAGSIPFAENYGVRIISMGFFIPEGQAVVWRGPMIHGAIQQMIRDVDWGELDYLLVDLPPGTGDASLSLAQLVPLTGAVVVLTSSQAALDDGAKSIAMFQKLNVPLLGLIENMSYLNCPHCGEAIDVFGRGASRKLAQKYGIDFLGDLPLDPAIRIGGDDGLPVVVSSPDSPAAHRFMEVAKTLAGKVSVHTANQPKFVPINMVSTPRG